MTREQAIRKEVLLQLYAVRPLAKSAEFLGKESRKAGNDYRDTEVVKECAFLEGQGLIEKQTERASGQVRYKITAAGILAYENEG